MFYWNNSKSKQDITPHNLLVCLSVQTMESISKCWRGLSRKYFSINTCSVAPALELLISTTNSDYHKKQIKLGFKSPPISAIGKPYPINYR